jgi:hypothetical protein
MSKPTHADDALSVLRWMMDDAKESVPEAVQDAVWRCVEELRRYDNGWPLAHPSGDWNAPPKGAGNFSGQLSWFKAALLSKSATKPND